MPELTPEAKALTDKIDALASEGAALRESLKDAKSMTPEQIEKIGSDMEALSNRLAPLEGERQKLIAAEGQKALDARLETLERAISEQRQFPEGFGGGGQAGPVDSDALYGPRGQKSFYSDVFKAQKKMDTKALARLQEEIEKKAMGEGTDSGGGFTVIPEVANELIRVREANGIARNLFSKLQVETDEVRFISLDNGLVVAWQAEFSEKIKSDFKFSEFGTHVYTAAGLAVASNQLLADSKWPIDQMINADLARRFTWLEENAYWDGDGEGEPLGIYRTPGVDATTAVASSASAQDVVDAIQGAITKVYTNFFGPPNAIVMHPRTWAYLSTARSSNGQYLIGPATTVFGRQPTDGIPGYNGGAFPVGQLFGTPVYTSPSVPTTKGAGSNESVIFVGDFNQGLILDRQGIQTDSSGHVFFTTNQTVFRSEERVGFTAGRYPSAFAVVQGAGLANH